MFICCIRERLNWGFDSLVEESVVLRLDVEIFNFFRNLFN